MVEHALFDVIAWLAALASGIGMWRWRLRAVVDRVAGQTDPGYFLALVGGAAIGAYAFGTLNLRLAGAPGAARSVLGALAGGIAAVEVYKLHRGIRGSTGVVFAVPIVVGIAVGRIGCWRAGLADYTYGTATDLPWGHDFGDGIPRHPAPLYETASMMALLAGLLAGYARRSPWLTRHAFYLVVGVYGAQRFAWEFLKPYATVLGPFNLFHVLAAGLVGYAVYMVRHDRDPRP
jgi:hypothetical protein